MRNNPSMGQTMDRLAQPGWLWSSRRRQQTKSVAMPHGLKLEHVPHEGRATRGTACVRPSAVSDAWMPFLMGAHTEGAGWE